MPLIVKISLCKITRASKLFQRNYYLPLLKPLSPKDALRRKIITGQNVLGNRIEHYIPVLIKQDEKSAERKKRTKGVPIIKKRVRKNDEQRYVSPFLDDDMENHHILQVILGRKGRGKGQNYIYEVPDKSCVLVLTQQMEKAIRDREIIDVVMAQRSEKIVMKVSNGVKITLPIASYDGRAPLYRGSGWTKEHVEEEHHHGKETMSIAKLFEAKESGVEEWELEMMRLANKRKKKIKGQENTDWKAMMSECLENMDWNKFEEDTKQIIDEANETVEEENIPMAVDDMEKTRNVNEKLKQGGDEVLGKLPSMREIPEVIRILETGELCELQNVSGVMVKMGDGRMCFVTGQMVKTDENEVFVPGQTITNDAGSSEYTPGITILMENEPSLIPGLVMGEEETSPMFLPGESTITADGQLQFESTADDRGEPSESSSPSARASPPPKPRAKKPEEEIVIKRRTFEEQEPLIKERVKKRPNVESMVKKRAQSPPQEAAFRPQRQPLEDPLKLFEERRQREEEEQKRRLKQRNEEKIQKEEVKIDKLRVDIRKRSREMKFEKPPPYQPLDPVKKSNKLAELEQSIKKGTFFDDERTKAIMENARSQTRMLRYMSSMASYGVDDEFGTKTFGFSRTRAG